MKLKKVVSDTLSYANKISYIKLKTIRNVIIL